MNRPVYYLEDRSPDQRVSLKSLVQKKLTQINEPIERVNPQSWAVYCSDRLFDDWDKTLRPRCKIVMAARFAPGLTLSSPYEDKKIIVVDKPPGLPTQKTLKAFEDNLYDRIKLAFLQKKAFPMGLPYVGLHHRLDRDTSGLVLMTKQRQVNKEVADLFKNRRILKEYQAYVEWGDGKLAGRWRQADPIKRVSTQKKKFYFAVDANGDSAVSEFEVLERSEGQFFKLACYPKTGRTHQLRVHLSYKGYPILGDSVYGHKKTATRMMLHASRLEFLLSGEKVQVQSKNKLSL